MPPPIAILDAGMVTGVGLSAAASCAAIRCALDNFQETCFKDDCGEWILGSEVPLEQPWRGKAKLVRMLAMALAECLDLLPDQTRQNEIPLIVNLAEEGRPGSLDFNDSLLRELMAELGVTFHPDSRVVAQGRVGGAVALRLARQLLYRGDDSHHHVIVAGVDSLLVGPTLAAHLERDYLLTAKNSDGFIPGEASGAVIVSRPDQAGRSALLCVGLGFARETSTVDSDKPLRAEGLTRAIAMALGEAGCDFGDLDFRLSDASGKQYSFKESALALSRLLRKRKEEFDIWHPADCIGEVGAAALPCMLAVALFATREGYAPGSDILCHLANDDERRAALVLRYRPVIA